MWNRTNIYHSNEVGWIEPIGWNETIKPVTYNQTYAKEIMSNLGYNYTQLGNPNANGGYEKFFFNVTILAANTIETVNRIPNMYVSELPKIGIGVKDYINLGWNDINDRVFLSKINPPSFEKGGYDLLFFERSWNLDWNPGYMFSGGGNCTVGDCSNIYNFDLGENMTMIAKHVEQYLTQLDSDSRAQNALVIQEDIAKYLPTIAILSPKIHLAWSDDIVGIDSLLLTIGAQEWNLVYRTHIGGGPYRSSKSRTSFQNLLTVEVMTLFTLGLVLNRKKY